MPKGSPIGPLLFLLFVSDLQSVITVLMLLFADDVRMMSPRSQSGLLQSSLYNVRKWSVNWDLPINPTKCNYITIGWVPPLELSFATVIPGDSVQIANVVEDLGVRMDSLSYSPSIASKARRLLLTIRRSFPELPRQRLPLFITHWFGPILSTLCRPDCRTLLLTSIV